MAEEKQGLWGAFAHAAAQLAGTPLPYFVGMALLLAAGRWDGHFRDTKGCFEVKEIAGRVFNVDNCSGKTVEVPSRQVAPAASAASS